jgi:hypothetical protein
MNPNLQAGAYFLAQWGLMFLPARALLCRLARRASQS